MNELKVKNLGMVGMMIDYYTFQFGNMKRISFEDLKEVLGLVGKLGELSNKLSRSVEEDEVNEIIEKCDVIISDLEKVYELIQAKQ